MAQAGLLDVMSEMAAQISSAIASVLTYEGNPLYVQVEPQMVLNPSPPTIDIYPGSLGRETDSAGMGDLSGCYLLTVRARINTADNDAAQDILLRFMDETDDLCIAAAVMDDETLNGYASSVSVRDPSGYTLFTDLSGGNAMLGFSFTAVVLPANS